MARQQRLCVFVHAHDMHKGLLQLRSSLSKKDKQLSHVLQPRDIDIPLCVDLDGSLIKTDSLFESLLVLIKQKPLSALLAPFALFMGKARFKHWLSNRVTLNVAHLAYNEDVLSYLEDQKKLNRKLILVSGASEKITASVFEYLKIFDEHYGSTPEVNLTKYNKSKFLVAKFGAQGFDYVGNSTEDLPVWRFSKNAILVTRSYRLISKTKLVTNVDSIMNTALQGSILKALCKAIRPHQWAKNLLLFVPMVLANSINASNIVLTFSAFVAFSLCASSVYLLNDLMDLESDRQHRTKKNRPIANGSLPIPVAVFTAFVLVGSSVYISLYLSTAFTVLLSGYFTLTLMYSLKFKQVPILDVMTLASLYTWRVFAGATAISVAVSTWLMAFSVFFFLSLALIKRSSELLASIESGKTSLSGRGYITGDFNLLCSLGSASGVASVLVLALYINSPIVVNTYEYDQLLWGICPLLLYWISYCWMSTTRGEMHDDPVLFATKDKTSYIISGLIVFVWVLARGGIL